MPISSFRFPFTKAIVTKIVFTPPSTASLLTNLVAYWKLDEASGTRNDSVGSNHLTDNNTVLSATGKISNAADFEADNSEYLSRASNSDLQAGDTDWTFAAWIKVEVESSFRVVVSKGWGGGQAEWIIYLFGGNVTMEVTNSIDGPSSVGGLALADNNWHFVVAWHDSVNNQKGFQMDNGTPSTNAQANGVTASFADFAIGASPTQGLYWDGLIDEVGWWRRVLTSDERTQLYNSGNGLTYPFA
jgi:hypothetical protein